MHPLKNLVLCAIALLASQTVINAQPSIQIISPQDQAFVNPTAAVPTWSR